MSSHDVSLSRLNRLPLNLERMLASSLFILLISASLLLPGNRRENFCMLLCNAILLCFQCCDTILCCDRLVLGLWGPQRQKSLTESSSSYLLYGGDYSMCALVNWALFIVILRTKPWDHRHNLYNPKILTIQLTLLLLFIHLSWKRDCVKRQKFVGLLDFSLMKGSSLHIGLYCTQINISESEKIFHTLKKKNKTCVFASKSIWVVVNTLGSTKRKFPHNCWGSMNLCWQHMWNQQKPSSCFVKMWGLFACHLNPFLTMTSIIV